MRGKFFAAILKILNGRKYINTSRRIAMGFALLIFIGALLLMLPISSKERVVTPFLTAIFTTTSATCVTGLVLVDTGAYYSIFGQAVIIALIQIGGLGFMTILTLAFLASKRNIGMRNRMMMAQTLGLDSMSGVVKITKHVLAAVSIFELAGALILSTRFVPDYGLKGIWYGIFHSISAFCNAGFDILGKGDSICSYDNDPVVILTLSFLIIIGGIGFIVWEDCYRKRSLKKLSVYSKLVFIITAILIVAGTIGFYVFESQNPLTLKDQPMWMRIMSSYFQSVTCRTAGYDSIGQANLTDQSKVLSTILMMIGGASGSTAGGVKVVSVGVIIFTLVSVIKSEKEVTVMGRAIGRKNANYAHALMIMCLCLVIGAGVLMSAVDSQNVIDEIYEFASAYGTVGLSVGVTTESSLLTKCLLMLYMFFGRVGIMTISVALITGNNKDSEIGYPEVNVMIG